MEISRTGTSAGTHHISDIFILLKIILWFLKLKTVLLSRQDPAISTLSWLGCWPAYQYYRKACWAWFFECRCNFWSWRDSPICLLLFRTFSIRFGSPWEKSKMIKRMKLTNPGLQGSPFLPGLSKISFIIYSSSILLTFFRKILFRLLLVLLL